MIFKFKFKLMKFQKKDNDFFIDDLFIDANLIDHKYIKRYFYSIKNSCKIF